LSRIFNTESDMPAVPGTLPGSQRSCCSSSDAG